jgi:hypothetical protein
MPFRPPLDPDRQFDKIITLREAAELSSVSVDTWKREHPDKIIRLSARRNGVRLRDALFLGGHGLDSQGDEGARLDKISLPKRTKPTRGNTSDHNCRLRMLEAVHLLELRARRLEAIGQQASSPTADHSRSATIGDAAGEGLDAPRGCPRAVPCPLGARVTNRPSKASVAHDEKLKITIPVGSGMDSVASLIGKSKRKQEMIFRLYRAGARTGSITARFGPKPHASIVIIKPQRRRPLPAGSGSRGCHDPL